MLFRFIFYCMLAYLAWRFIRWLIAPASARSGRAGRVRRAAPMVRCQTCGMFVTESSALIAGGRDFCSPHCLEQRARRA
jgi:hypothetical protein